LRGECKKVLSTSSVLKYTGCFLICILIILYWVKTQDFKFTEKKSRQKITTESPSLCTNKHQHNQWKLRLLKQIEEEKKNVG